MPRFSRYIGIDYSGARTADASLPGLRAYCAGMAGEPIEIAPPPAPARYWTRRGLAEWLVARLNEPEPTLVGIDHAFSFPVAYFETHAIRRDWRHFLDDFCAHWPTDDPNVTVDHVRSGAAGTGSLRGGNSRWRRLTERRSGGAKSVFHFDVTGQVAKSTHAGLPWLRFLRQSVARPLHFWPFDGWDLPAGASVVAEIYPALAAGNYPRADRTGDQHDAYSVAAWLSAIDRTDALGEYLAPVLTAEERGTAGIEGWILGVGCQAAGIIKRSRSASR